MDTPIYKLLEVARYLKTAPATLRSWVIGRSYPKSSGSGYFRPLIKSSDKKQNLLSFNNLIEAYVLRSLRQEHGVSIKAVRAALNYAQAEFNIPRLLLSRDLLTAAGDLFLQRYGELINLSRSGQLALRKMLEAHLRRIEWDRKLPVRIYPFIDFDFKKQIAIDPCIKFGRPVIIRKAISTSIIIDRIDAGESLKAVADDYDLDMNEIEMAILYERAA
jgi:uncharacterized protein (DUF433 family)